MSTHATLPDSPATPLSGTPLAWKAELNARVREHREGRRRENAAGNDASREARPDISAVAARVAARYREAPTYQEMLARSAAAAALAAEAALEAQAAAAALVSHWNEQERPAIAEAGSSAQAADWARSHLATPAPPASEGRQKLPDLPLGEATVEHHAPLPARTAIPAQSRVSSSVTERARDLVDAFADALVPAAQQLPAKLIEFPCELVAPLRQRPRLAERPFGEEEASAPCLRIFEVEGGVTKAGIAYGAETIAPHSVAPNANEGNGQMLKCNGGAEGEELARRRAGFDAEGGSDQSGWASIRLGEHPTAETAPPAAHRVEHGYRAQAEPALHDLAPLSDRLMAGLVDGGIVFACFLLSVLVFAACTVHLPAGKGALALALLVFGVLATAYGWMFMSFGGGSTPGMRYAHIALCTFGDENPTRKDLQNRIPATALALLPLGLGVFWALLDENKLGWHDRMTRTYQRTYR